MKAVKVRIIKQPILDTVWYFNKVGTEYFCKEKHPYNHWYSVIQQGEVYEQGFVIHEDDCEVIDQVNIAVLQTIEVIND